METEEKELIDLCGETPAKKPPVKPEEGDSLKKRNCLKDISNTLPQTSASDEQLNSANLTFLTYSFLPEQQNFDSNDENQLTADDNPSSRKRAMALLDQDDGEAQKTPRTSMLDDSDDETAAKQSKQN
jgi:hypothetical protein